MNDVMQSGQLLQVQPVDGEPIAFTPLAVDANPLAYLRWARKFPNEVQKVLKALQENQGIAISDPKISSNAVLGDAIQTGVLMPVQISGATGDQQFIFAPKGGLRVEERTTQSRKEADGGILRSTTQTKT